MTDPHDDWDEALEAQMAEARLGGYTHPSEGELIKRDWFWRSAFHGTHAPALESVVGLRVSRDEIRYWLRPRRVSDDERNR